MAANGKNSRRKKKRHIKKGPVLIAVILLLCGIGWLTYLYHEQIINKAKDIPNSFSYPTDYEEYVIRYSTKYKCDPVLVFSVIKWKAALIRTLFHQWVQEVLCSLWRTHTIG